MTTLSTLLKHRWRLYLCLLMLFVFPSGCVLYNHTPLQQQGANRPGTIVPASYVQAPSFLKEYPRLRQPVDIDPAGSSSSYTEYAIELPSAGPNNQPDNLVRARYYASRLDGEHPLVIILPVWGTSPYPGDKMTKTFLKRAEGEINVLNVQGDNYLFDWDSLINAGSVAEFSAHLHQSRKRLITATHNLRRLVDWAQRQPGVDRTRIGAVGFSMSAIVTSLASVVEPRLDYAVLVMGAADPARIITDCAAGKLDEMRDRVRDNLDLSRDDYARVVAESFGDLNIALYGNHLRAEQILFIDAHFDGCMPRQTRDLLWETLGRPERYSFMQGHRSAFLMMTPFAFNLIDRKIFEFVSERVERRRWEDPSLQAESAMSSEARGD